MMHKCEDIDLRGTQARKLQKRAHDRVPGTKHTYYSVVFCHHSWHTDFRCCSSLASPLEFADESDYSLVFGPVHMPSSMTLPSSILHLSFTYQNVFHPSCAPTLITQHVGLEP